MVLYYAGTDTGFKKNFYYILLQSCYAIEAVSCDTGCRVDSNGSCYMPDLFLDMGESAPNTFAPQMV